MLRRRGITNAGWKFYILYLAVDMLGILLIYLFFVETRYGILR